MGIGDRVKRLEHGQPDPRCKACAPWGDKPRLLHNPAACDEGCHEADWVSGPPERCESCGFEPPSIRLRHTLAAGRL
jgi:hypothetical protein